MIRITLVLTGALMASGLLPAPSAHACFLDCPDEPTNIDYNVNTIERIDIQNPLFFQETLYHNLDFSVLNTPDQTFVGTVVYRLGHYGGENFNLSVSEDISGNVPLGEQYNDFSIFPPLGTWGGDWGLGDWGEVYNDIGVTPEAFLVTPFGNIDFPTAFVEAVGPTFFEPWASVGLY
jgi:hypothetical protein